MCLAQGPQGSDAGEARTRYPSVSSQALYHWATALHSIYLSNGYWANRNVHFLNYTAIYPAYPKTELSVYSMRDDQKVRKLTIFSFI